MNSSHEIRKPKENTFLNIFCNILIPIFILNKGNRYLGPINSLLLAIIFPIAYGSYDLYQNKKFNVFSILGILNVAITGGLAIAGLGGIYFAIKEASFPGLIGIFVFVSAFTQKPFIETMFLNPTILKTHLIDEKLTDPEKRQKFKSHVRKSTVLLSLSFVLSAFLNFYLALKVFIPIPETLSLAERSTLLNEQIAKMTSLSVFVIMVPSMIFMLAIFWYLFHGIKSLTNIKAEELMNGV